MPSIIRRRAPGIARAVARAAAGTDQRVAAAVDDEWSGRCTPPQRLGAVAGGGDRVQLAHDAGGLWPRSYERPAISRSALLVERVGRASRSP